MPATAMTRHSAAEALSGLEASPLPEKLRALLDDCEVRLVDLAYGVGAAIAIDETGFPSIYVNARLDQAARERALRHELWHWWREDMFREADIREIEGSVPGAVALCAMDGSPLRAPAPVFDPGALRRVGRGLYLPEGRNLEKAAGDLRGLCRALVDGCRVYDVLQRPPLLPVDRLEAACAALAARAERAVAFVAWRPWAGEGFPALPVVMQFCEGGAEGALYYAADGAADNALVRLEPDADGRAPRLSFDVRRRRGVLEVCAIHREVPGGRWERVY